MASSQVFQGSPTEAERIAAQSLIWRKAMRYMAYDMRVAMPGIIRSFDAATQLCTVDLTINDKLFINNQWEDTKIPTLQDVLLMLPGDSNWAITFPNVVGSECLVIMADMCINAWWATGNISNQETDRRHDFSDPFAILRPCSQPQAISDYSTTKMQLRSRDGDTTIDLEPDAITVQATDITLDGALHISGTPVSSASATPAFTLPIMVGGDQYYLVLKKVP